MNILQQHPVFARAGVLLFLYGAGLLVSPPAWSQSPAMPPSPFAGTSAIAAPAKAADSDKTVAKPNQTDYLDTFLDLQRQNDLLGKLLERERSLVDIVQNYKTMGIDYTPPKPALAMCQELPDNLSCAVAYPDRYAGFLPPPAPLPAVPIIPVMISEDLPQAVATLSPDTGVAELMWTDITCLNSQCRAVITQDPSDPAARYTVKEGDILPPGGTVEKISSQGVVIVKGSQTIVLEPAPTRPFAMQRRGASS